VYKEAREAWHWMKQYNGLMWLMAVGSLSVLTSSYIAELIPALLLTLTSVEVCFRGISVGCMYVSLTFAGPRCGDLDCRGGSIGGQHHRWFVWVRFFSLRFFFHYFLSPELLIF
jgi:hypothetical protein